MKHKLLWALSVAILALVVWRVSASLNEFPNAQAQWTETQTFLTGALATTNTLQTNIVARNTYHTVQINNPSAATAWVIISRSVDGVYFIPLVTNTITTASASETTFTGKWGYVKTQCGISNQAVSILYLGQ